MYEIKEITSCKIPYIFISEKSFKLEGTNHNKKKKKVIEINKRKEDAKTLFGRWLFEDPNKLGSWIGVTKLNWKQKIEGKEKEVRIVNLEMEIWELQRTRRGKMGKI